MPPNPHPDSIPAPMWDIIYVAEQRVKYIVAPNPAAAGEEVQLSNLLYFYLRSIVSYCTCFGRRINPFNIVQFE